MISTLDDLLRCPKCRSPLASDADDGATRYDCTGCHAQYPVVAGVPDLMPRDVADDPHWSTWQQHLEAFQQRRETRIESPKTVVTRLSKSGGPQQEAFARFTGISSGVVLDIGCGPGKFRSRLPAGVHYIGLDPIPLPGVDEFDFVRALAEHLPLADDSVDHVTVLSAMDHFNDCERFLAEVGRVLAPGGQLHIIQQVHEPAWSVRGIAHGVKDMIEDRTTKHDDEVPHHMTEFHDDDLRELLAGSFVVVQEQMYSISRTAPRRLFVSAVPVAA
jgi:SAM-dependent methyltransferase